MKEGWTTKRLGDVVKRLTNGYVGPTRDIYLEGGIPYLLARHVKDNELDFDGRTFVSAAFNEKHKKSKLKSGDVLLVQSGHIGHSAVVTDAHEGHNCHAMIVISPVVEKLSGPFLSFYFNSPQTRREFDGIRSGSTVPHLTCGAVKEMRIPVPPLAEQQRIVGVLDEAFAGLAVAQANAAKNLQNARAIFESHLQAVFSQRGKGWVETTLGKATGGVFTGPFGSLLHKSDYVENGIPLVNPAHITDTGINPDFSKTVSKETAKRLENYNMSQGDIVIGRRGEMGRCAVVTDVENGWVCGTGSFFIKPSERCDPRFLVRLLRSPLCRASLEKLAGGAVMPNLSNTAIAGLSISLPPIKRQREVVEEFEALAVETQHLSRIYEQKQAQLVALKKSFLHQAFNGDL